MNKLKYFLIFFMIMMSINNVVGTSYSFPTPLELVSPAGIETGGTQTYAFLGHDNNNVTEYFTFNSSVEGGLNYQARNRFNGSVRYAVLDWAHPHRLFLVFPNLDVAYTDSFNVSYSNGYYSENVWPLTGCNNCNDLHKIGVLTSINTVMSGFVDSAGNLFLPEGLKIVVFLKASDYTKINPITAVAGTDFTAATYTSCASGICYSNNQITDMSLDANSNIHILIGSAAKGNCNMCGVQITTYISQVVFSGTTRIYKNTLSIRATTGSGIVEVLYDLQTKFLMDYAGNHTTNIVLANAVGSTVYLRSHNGTSFTDICPSSCAIISGLNGVQILNGYAYIASSIENKIYRFPTSITALYGGGYTPATPTPTPTPTPAPTSFIPGNYSTIHTTDNELKDIFWTYLFLAMLIYAFAFIWTIGDRR
jgi:hypothetical protein